MSTRRLAESVEDLNSSLAQWFPTYLGLWHPAEENYILQHPVANPYNFASRFDDSLKMYF